MAHDKSGRRPCFGIALGGGAARGWAHLGVLRALTELGIHPEIICGTSIGALVGGMYAAGKLPEFEEWVIRLRRMKVLTLLDFTVSGGGAVAGKRLMDLYREHLGDVHIEDLPRRYAAVATDLHDGAEVWLQEKSMLTAIRASISIPGVFTPVEVDGRWLVDGGLVNPVPVSLCRALGADVIIAVDLSLGTVRQAVHRSESEVTPAVVRRRQRLDESSADATTRSIAPPAARSVVATSLYIMQDRITRSRLAGDPPDLLLQPRVSHVPLLEFTGGQPTIDEGYETVQRSLPALRDLAALARE